MEPVPVACVSYLNALPFVAGLKRSPYFELATGNPARCTAMLAEGRADLALVPVAAIRKYGFTIVSDYCIGADGRVESVLLLSQQPLEQVRRIILDYQSQTSVALARVLEQRRWQTGARFVDGKPGFEDLLQDTTAGVVIGDRAMRLKGKFAHTWDLAHEWKLMTGLPFVFACWCAKNPLPEDTLQQLNTTLADGISRLDDLWDPDLEKDLSRDAQQHYLQHAVSYRLDASKRAAMDVFLEYAAPYLQETEAADDKNVS